MSRGAVYPIEQVGAAWTRQFAFGAVHEAVQNERVVWTTAGRQRATLRCNGLNLCPKRNLVIQKRVSGGPVFGAFIGILDMLHGCPLRRFRNLFETKLTPEPGRVLIHSSRPCNPRSVGLFRQCCSTLV